MDHHTSVVRRAVPLAVAVLLVLVGVGPATPARATVDPRVTVLTRNLYFGGDLTPSFLAPDLPAFLAANAALLAQVDRTNFPARATLIAREIRDRRPDLVGLQEVALWRTGPIGDPSPATAVRYDFLALLGAALVAAGQQYDVAVTRSQADVEAPAGAPFLVDARLTLRDVILVRRGGPVRVTRALSGSFATNLVSRLPSTGTTITFTRGWTAVDAVAGGRSVRFVNTHLEATDPRVRASQARELVWRPLGVPGRVVLVGDLNSGPDQADLRDQLAYWTVRLIGWFTDTWPVLHRGVPGRTADLGPELTEPASSLETRVDMVLVRGGVVPVSSALFGTERRTAGGRWASDHLGHVAVLALR